MPSLCNADYLSVGELIEKLKELPSWYLVKYQGEPTFAGDVHILRSETCVDFLFESDAFDERQCMNCDRIDPEYCNRDCEFADCSCKNANSCDDFELKRY